MTLPKSSVQLGWEDSPKKTDKPEEDAKVESAKGGSTNLDANAEANVTGTKKDVKVDANVKDSKSAVSSNAFASGSAQNIGNFLTDRPTSRVTQPPGGQSSVSLY